MADRLMPSSRLEAFSDGVFAIAITLLVLELHVPNGHEALVKALGHEWPRYLGYFVSFAFIGGVLGAVTGVVWGSRSSGSRAR
jgi:TMEM175 potassium channel family protein